MVEDLHTEGVKIEKGRQIQKKQICTEMKIKGQIDELKEKNH